MPQLLPVRLFYGFIIIMLGACAYQRPAGKWQAIETGAIYFSGVELGEDAVDSSYPDLCREAQKEINRQLVQRLPARIKPLSLQMTKGRMQADMNQAEFHMTITNCELDVKQWDASFTYYLTLMVEITLKDHKQTLMAYRMETYEQLQTDIPSPDFDFSFAEPVARSLKFFDAGRVWVPSQNQ